MVFCGHCGDIYRRVKWNNRGCKSIVWRCVSRVLKKSSGIDCPARTIHEDALQAAVVTAVNDTWIRRETVLPALRANIQAVIDGGYEDRLAAIDESIKARQTELLEAGRDEEKINNVGDEIIRLREERQQVMTEAALRQETKERLDDLTAFLDEQAEAVTEYSDALVRRLISKITVFDEKITVEFKSGLSVDVEA